MEGDKEEVGSQSLLAVQEVDKKKKTKREKIYPDAQKLISTSSSSSTNDEDDEDNGENGVQSQSLLAMK